MVCLTDTLESAASCCERFHLLLICPVPRGLRFERSDGPWTSCTVLDIALEWILEVDTKSNTNVYEPFKCHDQSRDACYRGKWSLEKMHGQVEKSSGYWF